MSDELSEAWDHTSQHRTAVLDGQCGCFHCLNVFNGSAVTRWADNGETAICPHCGYDAVLPASTLPQATDPAFLLRMNAYYFAGYVPR